tara:strand:+ start:10779 stop:14378 length:3600 start_codon:yes stop_codon:yes gene_type:complete
MSKPEFKNISPNVLTEFVSFFRDEDGKDKLFDEYNSQSMQYKQAEGSSYLFNLLNEKSLALLADEVGMGKTIQSLAICAALWQQKPDAKILVLAPRNEVAYNWINEYETFVKVHYKIKDDVVKSRIDGTAINPAIFCTNLYDLTKEVQNRWGRFFVGKISSFSGLYSQEGVHDRLRNIGIVPDGNYENQDIDKKDAVRGIAELLRKNISENLPDKTFDLIIIDEAHYFRNKDGSSLRVNVAEQFFNINEDKIAKRTLLLTATPNHSSSDNIKSIISYFDDGKYQNSDYATILKDLCLRRFRRLSANGKVKYNYRKEVSRESDFKDNMSELLFGIYQKQLVGEYAKGLAHGSKRNILGFLEGTEFIPHETITSNEDDKELRDGNDFSSGTDGEILSDLSREYQRIFKTYPSHPKYNQLVEDLIEPTTTLSVPNHKKLVFVRRIPSVREIAARTVHRYDEILLKKIEMAFGKSIDLSIGINDFRAYFEQVIGGGEDFNEEEPDFTEDELETSETFEKVPSSKVLYLFKTLKKKKGVTTSTDASRFRLRFTRSKPSIYNIFFAPGSNYFDSEYDVEIFKSEVKGKGPIDDYFVSCLLGRTSYHGVDAGIGSKIKNTLGGRLDNLTSTGQKVQLKTLFTIFWNYLEETKEIGDEEKLKIRSEYLNLQEYQKEALSFFIEKGVLLASTGLIDLYVAFIKASKTGETGVIKLYNKFTNEVENVLALTSIPKLITASILNFKILCEKVMNLTSVDQILNEEWSNFRDAQPAYAYSGDTKNQRVMTSFNTPFFPDILISTSVLQEGVNLQYFCKQIIHYGIAWTPGDNEQRVGRIDRMFSKTERMLDEDENTTLDIIYPYLKNTIDQDHLANFVSKKYFAENLIDKCQAYVGNNNLDPQNFNFENWKQFLRIPNNDPATDPYPAKSSNLSHASFQLELDGNTTDIREQIINTFKKRDISVYKSGISQDTICTLDPELEGERRQPVIVKLNYDPELTGLLNEVTYTLSLISPLGKKKEIRKFEAKYQNFRLKYENDYLTVKLCLDRMQSTNSMFGVYTKIEIPVFLNHKERPLSISELWKNYEDLILCSDYIEKITMGTQRDISMDDIDGRKTDLNNNEKVGVLRDANSLFDLNANWKRYNGFIFLEKKNYGKKWIERDLWVRNHEDKYTKYLPQMMVIPYHSMDIQKIELEALEQIQGIREKDKIWN